MAQFPKQIQAALLFDQPRPFDLDAFVQGFVASAAQAGIDYNLVFDTKPGVFYRLFGTDNLMITIEHVDGQARVPLFETALSSPFTRIVTPDARERIARHRSHVLVDVHTGSMPPTPEIEAIYKQLDMRPAGHSLAEFRQRLLVCGGLASSAHRLGGASLVHWTATDHLLTGKAFAELAIAPAPSLLHIHPLLFAGGKSVDGKDQVQIKTFGAAHFVGREVLFLPSPLPWPDGVQTILAFLKIATTENGYIIPDGDTFGPDDDAVCCRAHHVAEGDRWEEVPGPLYVLELLRSREHDYVSPDYIAPKRTFDDRTVPADVLAHLGPTGQAVVQDWRATRRMAEAAGNGFRVKTEMPPRRSGLRGWLPFGRRSS